MKSLVIGGTAGLGRALTEKLAQRKHQVIFTGRSHEDLERQSAFLQTFYHSQTEAKVFDLNESFSEPPWNSSFLNLDHLFICVGGAHDQDAGWVNESVIQQITLQNFTGPAQFLAAALRNNPDLKSITVISSIAAGVPRGRNCVYSSSKLALESFCQSMRVNLAQTGRKTRLSYLRLGYMRSQWTFGQTLPLPVTEPDKVAEYILGNLDREGLHYFPKYWCWIHFILRSLPWAIYRRLRF